MRPIRRYAFSLLILVLWQPVIGRAEIVRCDAADIRVGRL